MIRVRRGSDRFLTEDDGIVTRHAFSFGRHYDPGNVGFGVVTALNDESLPSAGGYDEHPHAELVIVSVVLEGILRHTSSVGSADLGPGDVQVLTAGTGVVHAERAVGGPARFLQTWIRPGVRGSAPGYAYGTAGGSGLVPLAGGDAHLALAADAALFRVVGSASLPSGTWLAVALGPGHVAWADGSLAVGDGDEVRAVDEAIDLTGSWVVWSL